MKGLRIAVIGATGNVGRALVAALVQGGAQVITLARSPQRFQPLGHRVTQCALDLDKDGPALAEALQHADCIINVAHARYTSKIIDALPGPQARLITLGSTRKFSQFPDQKAADILEAEAAHGEGVAGIMLHPAMIYGGADNNIRRMMRIIRWTPVLPLPLAGRSLLQPIHRDDVVQCLLAAIDRDTGAEPIIIAGPAPLSYAEIIAACAGAAGRRVRIAATPLWVMRMLAMLTKILPGFPTVAGDEVLRLLEDKAFDITAMQQRLGVNPCTFDEGLARMRRAGDL